LEAAHVLNMLQRFIIAAKTTFMTEYDVASPLLIVLLQESAGNARGVFMC
jgi:hypothetical protein